MRAPVPQGQIENLDDHDSERVYVKFDNPPTL